MPTAPLNLRASARLGGGRLSPLSLPPGGCAGGSSSHCPEPVGRPGVVMGEGP